ncbi:PLP-dependent aminotransferase family protein [Thalassolituus sp. LLYu03]|uniref:aminotransferase-like domain-containing protein n=1 Tax=Thalassolituus sp. LLYu03 TaxID=3421656 RepID=UPI003D29B854
MKQTYRYQQLQHELLQLIHSQRVPPGARLPSVRSLCEQHQVSKATVLHALQRLEAQGLIEARPKSGFYVRHSGVADGPAVDGSAVNGAGQQRNKAGKSAPRNTLQPPQPVTVPDLLYDIMRRGAAFDLAPAPQERTDASPGVVALNRAIGRALRRARGDSALYYDEPAGLPDLREQLAQRLNSRGCALSTDDLCITAGCQNALFLALMACCQPGDVVAVESPGFYGVLQLLEQLGLQVVEVPSSPLTGLNTDALADVLKRWPVRACVVSPSFSTPAGALMPKAARERLLALASDYDLALIEDDIYADTAFCPLPDPLKANDPEGRVMLCSSFSKTLSRDVRIGWIAGGRWQARIVQLKLVTQLASGRALQQGLADFLADGSYGAHLRRQHYRLQTQRDQLLATLAQWSQPLTTNVPQGGLTLWAALPPGVSSRTLYQQALADDVVITPGVLFSVSHRFDDHLRLSFAHEWTAPRLAALTRLGQLIATSDQSETAPTTHQPTT